MRIYLTSKETAIQNEPEGPTSTACRSHVKYLIAIVGNWRSAHYSALHHSSLGKLHRLLSLYCLNIMFYLCL